MLSIVIGYMVSTLTVSGLSEAPWWVNVFNDLNLNSISLHVATSTSHFTLHSLAKGRINLMTFSMQSPLKRRETQSTLLRSVYHERARVIAHCNEKP